MNLMALLPEVCRTALQAGELITQIYNQTERVEVEKKQDGTPVTMADKQADEVICQQLSALTPHTPLVTEESVAKFAFSERQHWSTFWLVDPLDGTKEFIERTGEFSVNIALVENGKSILGVVYVPMTRVMYAAVLNRGAYRFEVPENSQNLDWQACLIDKNRIQTFPMSSHFPTKVAISRRHGKKSSLFMEALGETQVVHMGSAIKSCLVAEGVADVYPRFGPTSLWDTAAAQCVVEEAGGKVLDAEGRALKYFQSETLLNPHFIVVGDSSYRWPKFPVLHSA